MLKHIFNVSLSVFLTLSMAAGSSAAEPYKHFKVAVYARAQETRYMDDPGWLEPRWKKITKFLHVDKIYLETHRDGIIVDDATLETAKKFFRDRGVKTSGGITLTVNERNRFQTFCYSDPEHRKQVRELAEHTARHFDELILDDFYFTNCKCGKCIKGKGEKSWSEYRTALLTEAAKSLIIGPAKSVNPDVRVIIKYPNWYEHFQGCGFDLEHEPPLFDGLYTGTETRDPSSNQHLQAYLGYLIFRYFENLKPGGNRGGWVDTYGSRSLDRYAEQLWLTLFAKAPEITLFEFGAMQRPISPRLRGAWQSAGARLDFDAMVKPYLKDDGSLSEDATFGLAADHALRIADQVAGELGHPIGLKSYKPYHSTGEDFLQTYFGMIGIPMDLVPEYPAKEKMVVLTETAKHDPEIAERIKQSLMDGNHVLITSGLLHAIEKDIHDIAELRYTDRKALVNQFRAGWGPPIEGNVEMLIPQIAYITNDSWEEISAFDETNGWPVLHSARYANGILYVLTIPESFTDLYNLPDAVLNRIRQTVSIDLPVYLEGSSRVSLFIYDNDTFIVESFRDEPADIRLIVNEDVKSLSDVLSDEEYSKGKVIRGWSNASTDKQAFEMSVKPHSFRVFRMK